MRAYYQLNALDVSLVLAAPIGARPSILYYGPRLVGTPPDDIALMTHRQSAHGTPDEVLHGSLLNEAAGGLLEAVGFAAYWAGRDWAGLFKVIDVVQTDDAGLIVHCVDAETGLRAIHTLTLDPETTIARFETEIINEGQTPLMIEACPAMVIPLPETLVRWMGFIGRWAGEFELVDIPPFTGSYVRENRAGRTSHGTFPGFLAVGANTGEQVGTAYGFHLGWSGNSRLRLDHLSDGRRFLQMGECFWPGEQELEPGTAYTTPPLYAGLSQNGLSGLSQRFHHHVRDRILGERATVKPRPVHYNTWEAVYFDLCEERLFTLAERAAAIGAERFVLDDGWFGARRHDRAGLGDWTVSRDVFPNGLDPLIAHVQNLGMEFGLWVEPEMVNPDSDLYRAHPDWVLQVGGVRQVPARGQCGLDLTNSAVVEHLYGQLDALLQAHDIAYLKWDMNRDLHHPGSGGRAVASRQTRAVYALMARLRTAHPGVEIESCASGGGRADYGVLAYTDRIWTSDSNDALDRQKIQRGASMFFPLDTLGAHVGPARCHITGRQLRMETRVISALFGHMGVELDLLDMDAGDCAVLKAGIALHKRFRSLLHTGDWVRLETPAYANAMGVVAQNQCEGLFSYMLLSGHSETLPAPLRFAGLDPARSYRVRIVWPLSPVSVTHPSIIEAADLAGVGALLSGDALMQLGLQMPLLRPETGLIFHLSNTV